MLIVNYELLMSVNSSIHGRDDDSESIGFGITKSRINLIRQKMEIPILLKGARKLGFLNGFSGFDYLSLRTHVFFELYE